MGQIRPISKTYNISTHRFLELYHFCLQYEEWCNELKYMTNTLQSPKITDMPVSCRIGDKTSKLAIRRLQIEENCQLIEQTAIETDAELYPYILEAVTKEGITYPYLKTIMDIPCSRNTYYSRRKRFYWLLSQKK